MPKLVCHFAGWCEIDTEDVSLIDMKTGETKTAKEWRMQEGFQYPNLFLESFDDTHKNAIDGEFTQLDLEIQ